MLVQKRLHLVVEREGANSHEIAYDSALSQQLDPLAYGWIATAQRYYSEAGTRTLADLGRRHKLRGGLVLQQQTIHHFLVFVRSFRIAAVLVVSGAAGEKGSLGVYAGKRPGGHLVLIFVEIALKFRDGFQVRRAQHTTPIGPVRIVPGETGHHPIIHSDV